MLARGDAAGAAALGRSLIAQYPGSLDALRFAVDAVLAQSGAAGGLDVYDRWTATSKTEDPPALHAVAHAWLKDAAVGTQQPSAVRIEMLQALANDGDADAAASLASSALVQQLGAGALASTGNDEAVAALLAQLQDPAPVARRRAAAALGASGSERAVRPLINALADDSMDVRATAAEALGRIGRPEAIGPLKGLLDAPFPVRYQAASALLALHDTSGVAWLHELARSPQPGIRLAALQALSSQPDGAWLPAVRDLTSAADPEIRRQAAQLLARDDPETAKAVLQPLLDDKNVAQREVASQTYLRDVETDLSVLRRYLHASTTGVHAALRILELTR